MTTASHFLRLLPALAAACFAAGVSASPVSYLNGLGVNTTGNLGAIDRSAAQWTPSPSSGVGYAIEDSVRASDGFVGPGYGGQPYDLEALYVQRTGTQLIITGVAGADPSRIPGSASCTTNCNAPTSYATYGMGDFFVGTTSGNAFNPLFGIELTGRWFAMDGAGNTTGWASPLPAGAIVDLQGSLNTSTGAVTNRAGWDTGLPNWSNAGAPSQLSGGYTNGFLPARSAAISYAQLGSGPHFVYQATISLADLGGLAGANDWAVRWGEVCGNDVLQAGVPAQVPAPPSIALLALGGLGLLAGRLRRAARAAS